jgi:hypothetical protein
VSEQRDDIMQAMILERTRGPLRALSIAAPEPGRGQVALAVAAARGLIEWQSLRMTRVTI